LRKPENYSKNHQKVWASSGLCGGEILQLAKLTANIKRRLGSISGLYRRRTMLLLGK
jgi:hypothetical protein